jgi:hypothetical protein
MPNLQRSRNVRAQDLFRQPLAPDKQNNCFISPENAKKKGLLPRKPGKWGQRGESIEFHVYKNAGPRNQSR